MVTHEQTLDRLKNYLVEQEMMVRYAYLANQVRKQAHRVRNSEVFINPRGND